jgi:hypothetical protein
VWLFAALDDADSLSVHQLIHSGDRNLGSGFDSIQDFDPVSTSLAEFHLTGNELATSNHEHAIHSIAILNRREGKR